MATPPPTNTGFVSLADYLGANQDAVNSTTQNIVGRDTTAAQNAENEADSVAADAKTQATALGKDDTFDPTSLADYSKAQQDASDAATKLKGLSDSGGVASQLQGAYGKTNGGETNQQAGFDASLLGGSSGARTAFGQAQGQYSNLADYLSGAVNNAVTEGNAAYDKAHQPHQPTKPQGDDPAIGPSIAKNYPDGPPEDYPTTLPYPKNKISGGL